MFNAGSKVVGIHCKNNVNEYGILGEFRHSGLVTDATWKCSNVSIPDWSSVIGDDTTWSDAYALGKNGISPWGPIAGISDKASWIWTARDDTEVWCRTAVNPCG